MKVFTDSRILKELVGKAERGLARSDVHPLMTCFHLRASDGQIALSANNFEQHIRALGDAEVARQGAVLLPGKRFAQLIKKLDGCVEITATEGQAVIACGQAKATMQLVPGADQFPSPPVLDDVNAMKLTGAKFTEIIKRVAVASAKDDLRQFLCGVLFEAGEDGLTCVGTDSGRMAVLRMGESGPRGKWVVPAKFLISLAPLIEDSDDVSVVLRLGSKAASIESGTTVAWTRLIASGFPERWSQLIPSSSKYVVAFDGREMLGAIERASTICAKDKLMVELEVDKDGIILRTENSESTFKEVLKADTTGSFTVFMQVPYLVDFLRSCLGQVCWTSSGEEGPQVFSCEDREGWVYVAMPVRR